jgi:hypothetical protein
MGRKKKIEFLMSTDWMFEKPIDREHKEYRLLSYFQKMGEKLDKMELYPGFIELSLHLANVQTLIKDKKIIYTNKKFATVDDELLVKDLKVRDVPEMSEEEYQEFIKILSYSAPRMFEYFGIAKSVWELVFDSVNLKVRKNTKNILSLKGYFYHTDEKTKKWYIWEYEKKPAAKGSPENIMVVNLIYSDVKNDLTIPKIVSTFSRWNVDGGTKMPVVEMLSKGDFPINETLLPLFKRKLISYIDQKQLIENYKKKKEELNS